ncbi:MAG: zinc dependent phospholipase C family protein [Myxococcaceae bacterium]
MKKLSVMSGGVLVALVAVLWPRDAHAWGPLAHMSFASGALSELSLFSPAVRMILSNFTGEFLYGGLAADIIVGKNLAPYSTHCHNWNIGFSVLDRAKTDAQRAFSFGFLSHLAADTVAHNYYVPYKTVQGFRIRAANHAYWEIRYDQKLPSDLWQLGQKVCGREYREHDAHLEDCLSESYVIPFSISKRLFGSILLAARLKKWQTLSRVLAGDEYSLHTEEVQECRKLAVEQIVGMLKHGRDARCVTADPTGGRNLHHANQLRLQLKDAKLPEKNANEVVRRARPAFREAIHGRLNVPAVYS